MDTPGGIDKDGREQMTALLNRVYGSVHTTQSNLKKLNAMRTLLYMKRDIGKSAIRSCLQAMTAKLAQLQTELEADLENACVAKEDKLQNLSDLYVKRVEEINHECPKMEELLLVGKEKEFGEQSATLCAKLRDMLSAIEKENLEQLNTSSWSTLEFVPFSSALKKSDMGYIRCCGINPVTLHLSPPDNGQFFEKKVGSLLTFTLHLPDDLEVDEASLQYISAHLKSNELDVEESKAEVKLSESKGVIDVSFKPQCAGTYQLYLQVYGQSLQGSPFKVVLNESAAPEFEMPDGEVEDSCSRNQPPWRRKTRPRVASSGLAKIAKHIKGEDDSPNKGAGDMALSFKPPKFELPCFSAEGGGLAEFKPESGQGWIRDSVSSETTDEDTRSNASVKKQEPESSKTVTITMDDFKKFRMPIRGKPALRKPLRKPEIIKTEPAGDEEIMKSKGSFRDTSLQEKKIKCGETEVNDPLKKEEETSSVNGVSVDVEQETVQCTDTMVTVENSEDCGPQMDAIHSEKIEKENVSLLTGNGDQESEEIREEGSVEENGNNSININEELNDSVIEQHKVYCPGKVLKAELLFKFGQKGRELNDHMFFPIGVTTTKNGQFVVADHGNDMVKIFDKNGEHLLTIGSKQSSVFNRPSAVVVNEQGELFVKDSRLLQVFDLHGNLLRSYGRGDLQSPYGLALNKSGHLVVMDTSRQEPSLVVFTQDGRWMKKIAVPVLAGVQGSKCRFMDCHDDFVVVSDLGRSKMYIINQQGGNVVQEFGSHGRHPGEFNEPSGVSVDVFGNIVVADSKNDRVQVFFPDGTFQCFIELSERIYRPSDLHLTEDGLLVISNFLEHCVKVYKLLY